jgi:amino acid transporter
MNANVDAAPRLHRVIGTLDMVLLNIAAIVGLRWLTMAAQIGPSSLTLWVLGLVTFFVPLALAVLELSSRLPGEGGFYLWSKVAFGDRHAFIAGWAYWVSNLVYFPSVLLFGAGVFLYINGGEWLKLADNRSYNIGFGLLVLWATTLLNFVGLERAKWLQNLGGIATWLAAALLVGGGALAWHNLGPATAITPTTVVPHLSLATLASFATIAFAFEGLELGVILGGEIRNPGRTIARATLIAGVLIAAIYLAGTTALLTAIPGEQINVISGIPQALATVGTRIGMPAFGTVSAVLLTLSMIGGFGAWMTCTARLPFLFSLDRSLPRALTAVHPRFGSPYVALLTQAVLTTIMLLAAVSGSAIGEAYRVLVDMTVILTFVPILYLFAALPVLRRRSAVNTAGLMLVPGGQFGCWVVAGAGFAITLLAVVVSMVPPEDSSNRGLFALKVVGGCAAMIAAGLVFYFRGHRTVKTRAEQAPGPVH